MQRSASQCMEMGVPWMASGSLGKEA
ncbi:hypothetical protein CMUS01_00153 [Colletotrichum musicola]|uniref:Uncharacterized protein n=1 Tax=Colletotrichum musicola TaxID=2175873 RepID=A0A8H6NZ96_9PEZI|nr:hypothetical protein CMUS01_00153 [Colletotrichum musicola]